MCYKHTMLEIFYYPANNFCHVPGLKVNLEKVFKRFLFYN